MVGVILTLGIIRAIFKYVCWRAIQDAANRIKSTDSDGPHLSRLQYRHIGKSDSHLPGKFAQRHFPFGEHNVKIHNYHN